MKPFLTEIICTFIRSYEYLTILDKKLRWYIISSTTTIIFISSSSLYLSIASRSWLPAFWFPLMTLCHNIPGLLIDSLQHKYNMKKITIVEILLISIDIPIILLNEHGINFVLYLVGIIDIVLVFNHIMLGVVLTREIESRNMKVEEWKRKTSALFSIAGIISSVVTIIITLIPNWYIGVIVFILISISIQIKYLSVLNQ